MTANEHPSFFTPERIAETLRDPAYQAFSKMCGQLAEGYELKRRTINVLVPRKRAKQEVRHDTPPQQP